MYREVYKQKPICNDRLSIINHYVYTFTDHEIHGEINRNLKISKFLHNFYKLVIPNTIRPSTYLMNCNALRFSYTTRKL